MNYPANGLRVSHTRSRSCPFQVVLSPFSMPTEFAPGGLSRFCSDSILDSDPLARAVQFVVQRKSRIDIRLEPTLPFCFPASKSKPPGSMYRAQLFELFVRKDYLLLSRRLPRPLLRSTAFFEAAGGMYLSWGSAVTWTQKSRNPAQEPRLKSRDHPVTVLGRCANTNSHFYRSSLIMCQPAELDATTFPPTLVFSRTNTREPMNVGAVGMAG